MGDAPRWCSATASGREMEEPWPKRTYQAEQNAAKDGAGRVSALSLSTVPAAYPKGGHHPWLKSRNPHSIYSPAVKLRFTSVPPQLWQFHELQERTAHLHWPPFFPAFLNLTGNLIPIMNGIYNLSGPAGTSDHVDVCRLIPKLLTQRPVCTVADGQHYRIRLQLRFFPALVLYHNGFFPDFIQLRIYQLFFLFPHLYCVFMPWYIRIIWFFYVSRHTSQTCLSQQWNQFQESFVSIFIKLVLSNSMILCYNGI